MIPERKRKRKRTEGVDGSENDQIEKKSPKKDHVSIKKKRKKRKKKEQEIDMYGETEKDKKNKEINPGHGTRCYTIPAANPVYQLL